MTFKKIKNNNDILGDFNFNVSLSNIIKGNTEYLYDKFPTLKNLDTDVFAEDTSILYFISSYFSSKETRLGDQSLIVYDSNDKNKFFVFLDKKIYVFQFDNQNDKASVELIENYQVISTKVNYSSQKDGIFRLNYKGQGFVNTDFNNAYDMVFKNTKNPEVSSITVKLNLFELDISSEYSNLGIDSIIHYIEKKL
ncbi:hypothetical protein [Staphylococcus epidermidis]|uniref:hypothetical protein n=1 Tax=Staphylococcus epidermidis TaxID=1282 RepID=UPI000DFEF788|nr:hypothetical protein [Staphylococcus epidermidis]SUM27871.1 Uncharacterised protein [Staphylococcus epidermidis]